MNARRRARYAYLFIAPFFLVFVSFSLYPIVNSLWISFNQFEALSGRTTFIGVENYSRLFRSNFFLASIFNTVVIWLFSIIPQLTLAFSLSLMLQNRWLKGRTAWRSIFYFPNLVTPVTIGVLFGILFSHPGGAVNLLLLAFGLIDNSIHFSNDPLLARLVVGLAICWQNFGFNIIFFTAGLNAVPNEIYEAADVDGASYLAKLRFVTIPLIRPMLIYIMITSIIGGLQIFDVSRMVFTDVPGDRTTTMVQYMYEAAFERWQLGFGAAAGYGIFIIIMIFSVVSLWISRRKGEVDQ